MCMMGADVLEALGIARGSYRIRVNNRKVLDGLPETIGISVEAEDRTHMTVLRSIDKFDKLGRKGVELFLVDGRKNERGDFHQRAGSKPETIANGHDHV